MLVSVPSPLLVMGSIIDPFLEVLKTKLANSTEAELKSLQSSLHSLKDGVAQDLQRNVFKKCVVSPFRTAKL